MLFSVCFCFALFSFLRMHEFKHKMIFFIQQSESVSSFIKGLIDYNASSFKEVRKSKKS